MAEQRQANRAMLDGDRRTLALRYTVLATIAVVFVFPLLFMIMSSFKILDLQLLTDARSFRAFLPVGQLGLDNYQEVFETAPVGRFMLNSLFVTLITLGLTILVCSLAGFAFAFLKWRGRDLVLTLILSTLVIPFETIALPLLHLTNYLPWFSFETAFRLGWHNSYHVQIVPWVVDGLSIFLFTQYFRDLPKDLVEAARAEGASWVQIYLRVIMPLSGPIIATAAILKFLVMYNQYLWPLMTVQSEEYRPILIGLDYFFQLNVQWGEVMAYLSLVTVPVLVFYLMLQRAFIASIAQTGVKG